MLSSSVLGGRREFFELNGIEEVAEESIGIREREISERICRLGNESEKKLRVIACHVAFPPKRPVGSHNFFGVCLETMTSNNLKHTIIQKRKKKN